MMNDNTPISEATSAANDGDSLAEQRKTAEDWLRAGEPLIAYNAISEAREVWPGDLRLRQLEGLALARSGALEKANAVLAALRDEGHDDGETMGLLGRTHKDLALSSADPSVREVHLAAAFEIYESAYAVACERGNDSEAYYTGINAATLALLADNRSRASEIAGRVVELCRAEIERQGEADYWSLATLGEAALILGDRTAAEEHYREAAVLAAGRYADLSSTRRQARLLLEHRGEPAGWLETVLGVPPVVAFSGHMVDRPDRAVPRFPAPAEESVKAAIRERLEAIRPVAAYGAAACGADILCLEAVLDLGGEIHITLPFPPAEFRAESVDLVPGSSWGERFERVLDAATTVVVASDDRAAGSVATFEYANLIFTGAAMLRAQVLETEVVGLGVWDGAPGDGRGGTAGMVRHWRQQGMRVEVVDVGGGSDPSVAPTSPADAGAPENLKFRHEMKSMLFADAVGYSKMTEDQIPVFVERFLGAIAELNDRSPHKAIHMETAGDGLYFVFEHTEDAGHYGLQLSELVGRTDWVAEGLPATLDMRVGLHCGPVYTCFEPITKKTVYTGPHTSRTARIEPITPPGQVYASSAFAAVAAASGVGDLSFDYVGRTNLAKKYGALALFHVRRPAS